MKQFRNRLTVALLATAFGAFSCYAESARAVAPDSGENSAVASPEMTNAIAVVKEQSQRQYKALQATKELREVGEKPQPQPLLVAQRQQRSHTKGRASWYGPGFYGRTTANGEQFNSHEMTAAHRSLPFGTKVRVTNIKNDRSAIVRINDRGPFIKGRVIDLSKAAARVLGVLQPGTAPVRLEILGR